MHGACGRVAASAIQCSEIWQLSSAAFDVRAGAFRSNHHVDEALWSQRLFLLAQFPKIDLAPLRNSFCQLSEHHDQTRPHQVLLCNTIGESTAFASLCCTLMPGFLYGSTCFKPDPRSTICSWPWWSCYSPLPCLQQVVKIGCLFKSLGISSPYLSPSFCLPLPLPTPIWRLYRSCFSTLLSKFREHMSFYYDPFSRLRTICQLQW